MSYRYRAMLDDPTGLRRMADQCRSLALSRNTEELRNIFLQMARRYDAEAAEREQTLMTDFTQAAVAA